MATLQKFKILATQCAVISSPTRSPTTSPVIHLRRRKTLRMLLGRSSTQHHRRFSRHGNESPQSTDEEAEAETEAGEEQQHHDRNNNNNNDENRRPPLPHHQKQQQINSRHKLKDLFISSPPPTFGKSNGNKVKEGVERQEEAKYLLSSPGRVVSGGGGFVLSRRRTPVRPLSATLRQRLLRRPWRPVLVAIPELSP